MMMMRFNDIVFEGRDIRFVQHLTSPLFFLMRGLAGWIGRRLMITTNHYRLLYRRLATGPG